MRLEVWSIFWCFVLGRCLTVPGLVHGFQRPKNEEREREGERERERERENKNNKKKPSHFSERRISGLI